MSMFKDFHNLVVAMEAEMTSYGEKPTKASSLRIRKLSLQLGKLGAPLRRKMLELDKAK